MKNAPEIVTRINFDKQDIVTVAMAKVEVLIRKNVRQCKEQRNSLTDQMTEAQKQIVSIGENNAPKGMAQKAGKLEKSFKTAGLSKTLKTEISFILNRESNYYSLFICQQKSKPERKLEVISQEIALTKGQQSLKDKVVKMQNAQVHIIADGVKWKTKLSDMVAIERQMRAKVVEEQLNKTTEGKALVDLLTKNYEQAIKLLEM